MNTNDYLGDAAKKTHEFCESGTGSILCGICGEVRNAMIHAVKVVGVSPDYILRHMATTFERRNAQYGNNYRMVGPIMKILFPNGVPANLLGSDQFHLLELKIVKLTRFAVSGLTHVDSIHDDGVYSALIESILLEKNSG